MYLLSKEKGNNENLTLTNVDTKASIILGKLTMEILDILNKEGYKFGDLDIEGEISLKDKWNLEISDDVGKDLAKKTFKMHSPVRDQSKKAEIKKDNKHIDAMDVLLGLASYN